MEEVCLKIVQNLKSTGITLLALDFDVYFQFENSILFLPSFQLTIVDCHTGGRWTGSVPELAEDIRPFFKHFIPAAINNGMYDKTLIATLLTNRPGIFVSIVTFSTQVNMIREVVIIDLYFGVL
jgi:hypothetical protein